MKIFKGILGVFFLGAGFLFTPLGVFAGDESLAREAVILDKSSPRKGGILKDLNIPLEVSVDTAICSKYIWRGFTLDDDTVVQPGIYASAYGFTASVWGSFEVQSNDALSSSEMDYSFDYTHDFGKFSLSLGNTYYDFPAADAFSNELYFGVGADIFLSPKLVFYHDYGREEDGGGYGEYLVLNLSHSLPLGSKGIMLDLGGHVGYNHKLFINGEGGDVAFNIGVSIPLTDKITFTPNVNYSIPFGDMEAVDDGNQDSKFYGGFKLAFGF